MEQNTQQLIDLLCTYRDKLVFAATYHLHDLSLAEDIVQDSYIKMIHALRNGFYTEQSKLLQWARTIVNNACRDHYRRIGSKPRVNDIEAIGYDIYDHTPNPEQLQIRRERDQDVAKLINELSPEQREVFLMRYYMKVKFKDISKLTGCNQNTIQGMMRYGYTKLRKSVRKHKIAC